jgi:hypothetical protein
MTHHRCPIVLDDDDDDDDARSSTSVVTVFIVLSSSSLSRSGEQGGGSGRRWMHQSIFVDSVGSESIHPSMDRSFPLAERPCTRSSRASSSTAVPRANDARTLARSLSKTARSVVYSRVVDDG